MDAASTIGLLTKLRDLAKEGALTDRPELVEEVARLRHFSQYQSKMDRAEYGHAFGAAAQAMFLVTNTGSPAFEDSTYQRVIEYSELALDALYAANALPGSGAIH
jgi:hypothetical protein